MSLDDFSPEMVEGPLEAVRPKTHLAADLLEETQGPQIGQVVRNLAADPPDPQALLSHIEDMDPRTRWEAVCWLYRYSEELADTGFEDAAETIMVSVVEPLCVIYDIRPDDFLDDVA